MTTHDHSGEELYNVFLKNAKLWYIYTMEYYAAERKMRLPFMTEWMELESITLSETSQVMKDKYHMISPINGT